MNTTKERVAMSGKLYMTCVSFCRVYSDVLWDLSTVHTDDTLGVNGALRRLTPLCVRFRFQRALSEG